MHRIPMQLEIQLKINWVLKFSCFYSFFQVLREAPSWKYLQHQPLALLLGQCQWLELPSLPPGHCYSQLRSRAILKSKWTTTHLKPSFQYLYHLESQQQHFFHEARSLKGDYEVIKEITTVFLSPPVQPCLTSFLPPSWHHTIITSQL